MRPQRKLLKGTILGLIASAGLGLGAYFLAARPAYAGDEKPKAPAGAERVANELSAAFEYSADMIRPSVVAIQATKHVKPATEFHWSQPQSPGENQPPFPFGDRFFRHFFENPLPNQPFTQEGLGSGLIIRKDGYILTNNHVVEGADDLSVKLHDGRELTATVVGRDPATDLAVIKVKADGLPAAELGDSDQLRVGEWVLAVGDPFGLNDTITSGIVSARGRANVHITQYEDFIQTDAAINPGNSGGPLVDLDGHVVGINTAIASRNGGNMGVGFAIPINMVKSEMQTLVKGGHVERGWLGIAIQELTPGLSGSFKYDSTRGALVSDVQSGSPAEKAGLKAGDIVTRYENKPVAGPSELRNEVAGTAPGTKADITVYRDGRDKDLTVKVGELKEEATAAATGHEESTALGLTVENLSPQTAQELGYSSDQTGVLVTAVEPGSLAADAGVQANDLILSVQDKPVENVAQFRAELGRHALKEGVRLTVQSGSMKRYVFLRENEG
jgi:serine protease Do